MGNLNDLNFNAEEVEPSGSFEPLPAGLYPVVIMDSDVKTTKAGTGEYLQFQFEVIGGGDYEGRYLWARMNIKNPNSTAVEIGLGEFSALCRAVNVLRPTDTTDLHNKTLTVKVVQRKRQDTGEMTNEIKSFEANGNKYPDVRVETDKEDGLPF